MINKIEELEAKKAKLKQRQEEINQRIRRIKSKENQERKKKENHYKILMGAFFLNDLSNNRIDEETKRRFKSFINDDIKFNAITNFIDEYKPPN